MASPPQDTVPVKSLDREYLGFFSIIMDILSVEDSLIHKSVKYTLGDDDDDDDSGPQGVYC